MGTFAQKQKTNQPAEPINYSKTGWLHYGQKQEANSIVHLQRTNGNHNVLRWQHWNVEEPKRDPVNHPSNGFTHDFSQVSVFSRSPVKLQPKLTINAPCDSYEQEADRIAKEVMQMPEPHKQIVASRGECTGYSETDDLSVRLHRINKVENHFDGGTEAPPIVHEVLRSPGRPLDTTTRTFMDSRFGRDFSQVRIHIDEKATNSARVVNALAYTSGRDIVFNSEAYRPDSSIGKKLLAHELVHVIQQSINNMFSENQQVQRSTLEELMGQHSGATDPNEDIFDEILSSLPSSPREELDRIRRRLTERISEDEKRRLLIRMEEIKQHFFSFSR